MRIHTYSSVTTSCVVCFYTIFFICLLVWLFVIYFFFFFFSSRRRHTRLPCDWSSDVCSSDLGGRGDPLRVLLQAEGHLAGVGTCLWTGMDAAVARAAPQLHGAAGDRRQPACAWGCESLRFAIIRDRGSARHYRKSDLRRVAPPERPSMA